MGHLSEEAGSGFSVDGAVAGGAAGTSLVLVSGSLRAASVNTAALRVVRSLAEARPDISRVTSLSIGNLPFYNGDIEAAGLPDEVREAKAMVAAADALVIATPAYNGAPPGVLKNALDWLSRPPKSSVLSGKVVATLSASPSRLGGHPSQVLLREVLARSGAVLVEHELVAISDAVTRSQQAGEFTEPELVSDIESLLDATVMAVTAARSAIPGPI